MSDYALSFRATAELDVARAAEWYEQERVGLGEEFLDEFDATCSRVLANPLVSPIINKRRSVRRKMFKRFPYRVFYTVDERHIIVLAVVHCHRGDPIWKKRVE